MQFDIQTSGLLADSATRHCLPDNAYGTVEEYIEALKTHPCYLGIDLEKVLRREARLVTEPRDDADLLESALANFHVREPVSFEYMLSIVELQQGRAAQLRSVLDFHLNNRNDSGHAWRIVLMRPFKNSDGVLSTLRFGTITGRRYLAITPVEQQLFLPDTELLYASK
jgi:hypothetical protein